MGENNQEHRSPSVGNEIIATLSQIDPQVILSQDGTVNRKNLDEIMKEALTKETWKPFTLVGNQLEHQVGNRLFLGNPLSESHQVLILFLDDPTDIQAHYDITSCLGHKHGLKTYEALKIGLGAKELSKMDMPVIVGNDILYNPKKLEKYRQYMLKHSVLSKSNHPMSHLCFVMFGGDPSIAHDHQKLNEVYMDAMQSGGKKHLSTKHVFDGGAATILSVSDDIEEYGGLNMYPEHQSAVQVGICDLNGDSVKSKLDYLRGVIRPKKTLIYWEPLKGDKEVEIK